VIPAPPQFLTGARLGMGGAGNRAGGPRFLGPRRPRNERYFGYALGIGAPSEAKRHSKSRIHEGAGTWMRVPDARKPGEARVPCNARLSFVSKRAEGEKGTSAEEKRPVSRSMEGWEGDFASLYILLSLPLVSWECKR